MLEKTYGEIMNVQSRNTGSTEDARYRRRQTKHNATQKPKKIQQGPHQKSGVNTGARE